MSSVEHIHRQHRGYKRRTDWAKRAEQIRRDIETHDYHVTAEPKLRRVLHVEFSRSGEKTIVTKYLPSAVMRMTKAEKMRRKFGGFRRIIADGTLKSVKRMWCIEVRGCQSSWLNYWERIDLALAVRDGFAIHYARYVMSKGTAAEGM